MRAWLLWRPPPVTNVSHPRANASAQRYSSLRALLPPPASPVQSSRLTHSAPGSMSRAAPSRSIGSSGVGKWARDRRSSTAPTVGSRPTMTASTAPLILWDIDGTLLRGGPAARDVFDQAIEAAVGRHPGAHGVTMGGKTDPQIALEILAFAEVLEPDAHGHLPTVLGHLEAKLAERADDLRRDGFVCPWVE